MTVAQQYAKALRMNGERYHNDEIDHDQFHKIALSLWKEIESRGLHGEVVEMIGRGQ